MLDKIKIALLAIWLDVVDTYKKIKIYLIGIGAIIAFFEWQKIKTTILVYTANKENKNDNKQAQLLADNENTSNQQANALVQQSTDLSKKEPQVTDDNWYKDSK